MVGGVGKQLKDAQTIRNELLVLRCQQGESAAIQELIDTWERRLFYYLRRLLENEEEAWDALQEVWLKVMREIRGLRQAAALPTWLYRIARNTAISRLRVSSREAPVDEDQLESTDGQDDPGIQSVIDASMLHHALQKLSLPHREALTLHFLEDMKVDQIAEVIGAPPGTVKARLFYAKRALRQVLEQEGVAYV